MPTKIAWTDESWNPVTGCTPVSEGCAHCYAKRFYRRTQPNRSFSEVTLHPDRLEIPLHWRKPRKVFVCSMGDLFHEDVPDEFIEQVWLMMHRAAQHTFQVLTKRPERMRRWVKFWLADQDGNTSPAGTVKPLANVWLGVSVENQARADERIPLLLETPAAVRFVSAEPLLGSLDLGAAGALPIYREADTVTEYTSGKSDYIPYKRPGRGWQRFDGPGPYLDWVIVGGESGGPPERRLVERCADRNLDTPSNHPLCGGTGWCPRPEALEWVRDIRDQCQAAGVPFFFKQWGPRAGQGTALDGRKWQEMPDAGR